MAKRRNFEDSGPRGGIYVAAKFASRQLRSNPTDAERIFWNAVSGKQLAGLRFNRQRPIFFTDVSSLSFYIADFYCHAHSLIIEIDGPIHKNRWESDSIRDDVLASIGLHVLRFTNEQVETSLATVLATIVAFVDSKR